jgi:hypothetical protein
LLSGDGDFGTSPIIATVIAAIAAMIAAIIVGFRHPLGAGALSIGYSPLKKRTSGETIRRMTY